MELTLLVLCGRSRVGAEMANENHGSPREEASLLSHSPGTSNQNQPCSPKPVRLVQDLPGTGGSGVGWQESRSVVHSPDCLGCTFVCRGTGTCRLGEVLEPKGEPSLLLQPIHQPVPVGDACAGSARCACECQFGARVSGQVSLLLQMLS